MRAKAQASADSSASGEDQDEELGPYGDYQSQTGILINTMSSLLTKTKKQLKEARTTENEARKVYGTLKKQMETEIANKKTEVASVKVSLSTSSEKTGQMNSQLLAAKQLLKTSKDDETQLTGDYTVKSANYKERTKKRSDEALAVNEAIKILSSTKAEKSFNTVKDTTKAKLLQVGEEQVEHEDRPQPAAGSDDSEDAPVSFMETKAKVHRHLASDDEAADPFAKVKTMLRGMLRKLNGQQAQDVKRAAWCDDETAKSTKEQALRQTDVQKLKDRIEEMDARLVEVGD